MSDGDDASLDALSPHKLSELKDEASAGLRIFVETAWGWADVKVPQFLKLVEKRSGKEATVVGYCDVARGGAMHLRIPRRV